MDELVDILKDLKKQQLHLSRILICNSTTKSAIEDQLPPNVVIIPYEHVEDNVTYLVNDENLKKMFIDIHVDKIFDKSDE